MTILLERVRAATGPDREIDEAIWFATVPGTSRRNLMEEWPDEKPIWEYSDIQRNLIGRILVPNITASVDAILALIERELPGWTPSVGMNVHHKHWHGYILSVGDDGSIITNGEADAPTPALALCAAFLAAKETTP